MGRPLLTDRIGLTRTIFVGPKRFGGPISPRTVFAMTELFGAEQDANVGVMSGQGGRCCRRLTRPGTKVRSIVQQLLSTMALIYHNSRCHNCRYHNSRSHIPNDAIYLDLRKALKEVHDKLLAKLWSAVTAGTSWRWVNRYMSDRSQLVSIGNTNSDIYQSQLGSHKTASLVPYYSSFT